MVEAVASSAQNTLMAYFGANIIFSILGSGLLQFLWGLINTLQIIMLTSLFDLHFPDNANRIMTMIMKLCAADFIDTDWVFIKVFGFRETRVFKSNINADGEEQSAFANAGYDSSVYFMLLGPIFFIVTIYALLVLLKKISQLATLGCSENFLTKRLRRAG